MSDYKGPPGKRPAAKSAPSTKGGAPAIDFAADKTVVPVSSEAMTKLGKLADRHATLKNEIADEAKYIQGLADEMRLLELTTIPELMKELGLSQVKTESGLVVNIKPYLECSIPSAGAIDKASGDEQAEMKERLAKCLAWLKENDGESIIKSELEIAFGKGEADKKKEVLQTLTEVMNLAVLDVETVHPMTLKSFLKEKLEKGADIPFDDFKIYSGDKAEIKVVAKK